MITNEAAQKLPTPRLLKYFKSIRTGSFNMRSGYWENEEEFKQREQGRIDHVQFVREELGRREHIEK